jgi:hypothetical protein
MGGAMPGTCFYIGNMTIYYLAGSRMAWVWGVAAIVGLICAALVGVVRRFRYTKIAVGISAGIVGASVIGLIWIDYSCLREMAVPARIEGDRVLDNDANIRVLFLIEGIVTPVVLLSILGTFCGWLRISLFQPNRQHG